MKKLLVFVLGLTALIAVGQPLPPATTPVTRAFLRSQSLQSAKASLGLMPTRVVCVDPTNGNDGLALTNSTRFAFKLLDTAATNLQAGDVVLLSAGVHFVTNHVFVPIGGAIIGVGTNLTTVKSYVAPIDVSGPTFLMRDNSYIADMTIDLALRGITTNATYTNANSMYQAAFGSHRSVNGSAGTNWIAERVTGLGETDVFFCRDTNICSGTVISCNLTSKWDAIATMEGKHRFEFINCTVSAVGPAFTAWAHTPTNANANCSAMEQGGQTLRYYGCFMYASNQSSYVLFDSSGSVSYNYSTNEFFGCTLTNANAGHVVGISIDHNNPISVYGCTYKAGMVDNNGGDGTVVEIATDPSKIWWTGTTNNVPISVSVPANSGRTAARNVRPAP